MIGVVGEDDTGYRWLPPRASDVHDGMLRVIPYASKRRTARLALMNSVLIVLVFACRRDGLRGIHPGWHAAFYQVALAVLLVQLVLRLPGWFRRRAIRVTLPLVLAPVPALYWAELLQFFCALSGTLLACIDIDHPHPRLPWEILLWVGTLACCAVALAPWFGRHVLRRRGVR